MPQHDKDIRDKDVKQASQLLQIVAIAALVIIAVVDATVRNSDVPMVVYYILGGVAVGVDNVKKLFGGGK